jgi:predicted  nucleic acid-binding Zn ribbon protein
MYVLEIKFQSIKEESMEEIEWFLAALRGNGQIIGKEYPVAKILGGEISTYVLVYEKDSLDIKNANQYVKDKLEKLIKLGSGYPIVTVLGEDSKGMKPCSCEKITSYILFTTYLSLESPLRCMGCFHPIPLYKIPPTHDIEYMDILSWQTNYQSCDSLQMNCYVGEKFATQQMSKLNSHLTKQGLGLCKKIRKKTLFSTYYYLYKDYCRSPKKDKQRKCPSCSSDWLLERPLHSLFDFQCTKCFLLSNIAWGIR